MFNKSPRIVRALAQCESISLSPLKRFSSITTEGCGLSGDSDRPTTPILQPKWHAGNTNVIHWRALSSTFSEVR